jgi:hypothetical protein
MNKKILIKLLVSWFISSLLWAVIFPLQFFWLSSGLVPLIINLFPCAVLGMTDFILDKMKIKEGINRLYIYLVVGIICFIWLGLDWRLIGVGLFYGLLYYMSKHVYYMLNSLKN